MHLPLLLAIALAAPQPVTVGVYLRNVDALDFRTNSYSLDFDLWMKWRGELDPTQSLRLTNVIDKWGLTITPAYPEPRALDDGSKYQRFHVEGRFYHGFWLGNFPLDWQKITLELEDATHDASALIYVPDEAESHVRESLTLAGWNVVESFNEANVIDHGTSFGLPASRPRHDAVPRYRFGLRIERPTSYFWLKVMWPMVVVLLSCFFVTRLHAWAIDARSSTIVVAILTEVFLQLQLESPLPNIGMLVLLDHLFNWSYCVMAVLLIQSILMAREWEHAERVDEQATLASTGPQHAYAAVAQPGDPMRERIDRIDTYFFWGAPLVYVLGCAAIILWLR